jgi:hypothetical protein
MQKEVNTLYSLGQAQEMHGQSLSSHVYLQVTYSIDAGTPTGLLSVDAKTGEEGDCIYYVKKYRDSTSSRI